MGKLVFCDGRDGAADLWLFICDSVKVSCKHQVATLLLRAHRLGLVTALYFPRALGSSGKWSVTPTDGPLPGDHYPFLGLLPVPCGPEAWSQKRTGSPGGHRGH